MEDGPSPANETNLEKEVADRVLKSSEISYREPIVIDQPPPNTFFGKLNARVTAISYLEARGIARVPEDERNVIKPGDYFQMALLWFTVNLTANNISVGLLGPLVWDLSFVDSALCAVFGGLLGAIPVAYVSTFGPASGNRTMVVARYFMGYYPSKLACVLNIVIMLGYGMIDCIIGGQILSAVSGGSMSIVVGIIINALVTWVVATFGMKLFHRYERYAFIPQVIILFIMIGSAGPKFDTLYKSAGNPETVNGNRATFLSLCLSAPVAWTPSSCDYFVYYPPTTKKPVMFLMTMIGFGLSFSFVYLVGIGLATATFTNPSWNDAYEVSAGALMLKGYDGLGGFGKFCGVVLSFGVIANNIPGTYSAALGFQVLGRWLQRIPRWFLTFFCVVIYTACALGGRNNLFDIFENFLALMGYWSVSFFAIVLEEHVIFRRNRGFDWSQWANRKALPIGFAALASFLVGWAGAIVGMDQVWYVGPIADKVGDYGADLGIWLCMAWTAIVFPPLRALELSKIGR